MKNILEKEVKNVAKELYSHISLNEITVETSGNFGDYASNIALILAGEVKKTPRVVAEKIVEKLRDLNIAGVKKIEIEGPGFINFYLTDSFFIKELENILKLGSEYGKNKIFKDKKIMIEYTDPNPFKVFHIGHLMTNTIGESLSRLFEFSGAIVKRANYQGDIGMHVAKALWGMQKIANSMPAEDTEINKKTAYLGEAYILGSRAFEDDDVAQKQIKEINKKIYESSDEELNRLYRIGREWSLEHFEEIYKKLGTKFDYYFFESQTFAEGVKIVKENLTKGVFRKSDGAVIFPGEEYDLHNRVFLNSEGLPTYEAKDLGLAFLKHQTYPTDVSIMITANEQSSYFSVVLKALEMIAPTIARGMRHIDHGMLRMPSGKMSSRTGDVITGESLLKDSIDLARSKITSDDNLEKEQELITEGVGVGAIKFSILRRAIGKDIIYDEKQSLSFDGDSGPYIQYTNARAQSILQKANEQGIKMDVNINTLGITNVERILYQFPSVVERATRENAPHFICTYLLELSSAFNTYYANTPILTAKNETPYRITLTQAVSIVLKNGLFLLGITAPKKM
ncbi:arginine--tRNA ligase [Patescibacteria group bacterium]|nr:arginine--tRNA ligase [Patescibacteria group bacterium]MBU1246521.1 arginine--tRNA ligase [Patescibacteria group bacterium]MBU1519315.1 arginine--tRNA ligase [Patescibacteria group bacterium]MBU1730391.1 arginine--tRNA ligase [Patescibacteria group bacterium]MBU1956470.1 arginine--tRNA ligase [Patescibacteria group bacterium]